MTIHRAPELRRLLDAMREAIAARGPLPGPAARVVDRIFMALEHAPSRAGDAVAGRVPACDHLAKALAKAWVASPSVAQVADAFAAIEPSLSWQGTGLPADVYAAAIIVGPGGLESRDDLQVGVSLMAPGRQYPDHRHPPEEIYLVLSQGAWRQEDGPWHEPGPGGVVFNPPDVIHAMRSADDPLLAIWCLWPRETPEPPPST